MLKRADVPQTALPEIKAPGYGRIFLIALPFWAVIVAVSSLSAVFRGYVYWWINVPLDSALIVYASIISAGVYTLLRRIIARSFVQQVFLSALLVVCLAIPFEIGFNLIRTVAGPEADTFTLEAAINPKNILQGALFWVVPWSLWAAASLATLHNLESRRRDQRLAAVQWQAHEAQVRALRYQINPHFLYNTLSSVSTLILEGEALRAEKMIMRLSDFFRASLSQDPFQDVRLADEMELQRLYLAIEQMRFSDGLSVVYDIPDSLGDAQVPSLILQPLVENSIKHGLQELGKLTTITIRAREAWNQLILEVSDDGAGPGVKGGTGVGLANVERRLTTRFGDSCSFEAGPGKTGGFCVRMKIPLRFA